MSKILDQSVTTPDDGGTWDFQCPGVANSICGDGATGQPFSSTGWPTKKSAMARARQHFAEHRGEGPAQSLDDFRSDQGLYVHEDGTAQVKVEDL